METGVAQPITLGWPLLGNRLAGCITYTRVFPILLQIGDIPVAVNVWRRVGSDPKCIG